MSAWDEVAIRAMCNSVFTRPCEYPACDGCDIAHCEFPALAPHLAARDAAVRREALEEAATLADKYHDLPEWAHGTALDVGEAIRALATEATP